MARIGVVHVLKHWLESSKTYHGPINLRFTWPIELTKTHLLSTDYDERWIVYMLGNRHHGFMAWLLVNGGRPFELPIIIEMYHRGREIFKYVRKSYENMEVWNSIRVTEAHIAIPVILYVHRFKISWARDGGDIARLILVRAKTALVDMRQHATKGRVYWISVFTCGVYRSYKSIPIDTPYISLLQQVFQLAE